MVPAAGGGTTNVVRCRSGTASGRRSTAKALTTFTAFAAIAGVGGCSRRSISNYTREQGWGMGSAGRRDSEPRSAAASYVAVARRQGVPTSPPSRCAAGAAGCGTCGATSLAMWLPACGRSASRCRRCCRSEYLPRGTQADSWIAGRHDRGRPGGACRRQLRAQSSGTGILVCGVLVLLPERRVAAPTASCAAGSTSPGPACRCSSGSSRTASGTSTSAFLRHLLRPRHLRFLSIARPLTLVVIYGNMGNLALGVNCFHTIKRESDAAAA